MSGKKMGKQWEDNGKTMGRQWEDNGKTMEDIGVVVNEENAKLLF